MLFSAREAIEAEGADGTGVVDGGECDRDGGVADAGFPGFEVEGPGVDEPSDGEGPCSEEEGVDWKDYGCEEELCEAGEEDREAEACDEGGTCAENRRDAPSD